jgi:hypothetical protein
MSLRIIRAAIHRTTETPVIWVCPMFLTMLTIGCAGPMGPISSGPPPPPPVSTFDGSYRTTIRLVDSFGVAQSTPWCDSPGQPVITVANGQFSYTVPHPNIPGNAAPVYPATMAVDGSFSGQIIAGMLYGQVQGNHIEGKIDGSACVYAFSGERI